MDIISLIIDDVINVNDHRLDFAKLENAIVNIDDVVESVVVSTLHKVKGESIYNMLH